MKVILNSDIVNIGEEGDIIDLRPGFVRNYLLPRNLVSLHNKANLSILEGKRQAIEHRRLEKIESAKSLQERLEGKVLEFFMPAGDSGKLFGAVTPQMIVDELAKEDMSIERKSVEISGHSIKVVGSYSVSIHLYNKEKAKLQVKVHNKNKPEAPPEPSTAEAATAEGSAEEAESAKGESAEAKQSETSVEETAAENPADSLESEAQSIE